MNKVKVLVEGYAKEYGSGGYQASSSVTLIETDLVKIVCDPGINLDLLSQSLAKEDLRYAEIDYVFLTHTHIDHAYSLALFNKAKVVDYELIYDNDKELPHHGKLGKSGLEIISTPGHSDDHCSLVVPTEKGVYVAAGDVFWWIDDEEQKTDRKSLLSHRDLIAVDSKALIKSRKKVLEVADWVIPGHGKVFRV